MNQPKRWVESQSEAEPVIRAVMRYAQQRGPSASELHALTQAVLQRSSEQRRRSRTPKFLAAFAAGSFGMAGLAWAGHAVLTRAPRSAAETPVPVSAPRTTVSSNTKLAPPALEPPVAPAPSVAPRPSSAAPAASAHGDVALLKEARRALASSPGAALRLVEQHQSTFPNSQFAEERAALRIESLVRLGRRKEAERRVGEFARRYPKSIYLRRMIADVGAQR